MAINGEKYAQAVVNSVLLFLWTEFVFFLLLLVGVSPLSINPIGRSQEWIIAIHLFLMVIALLYGVLQLILFCKNERKIYKVFMFYGLWWGLSMFFCGLLFTYLDMKFGYFVFGDDLLGKMQKDMCRSFVQGSELIIISFPFNVLVLAFSFLMLYVSNLRK